MCGLAGYLSQKSSGAVVSKNILNAMASAIEHRGPDNRGIWFSENGKLGMAHQRLSIIDTSSAGSQPMMSRSGKYIIIFNGEIYNHNEIRKKIELKIPEHRWNSYSDTETLLESFDAYGIIETLSLVSGMFSIVVWDFQEEILHLIRDRFGEKPLYYGNQNGCFLFASELKSLKAHPKFQNEIDRNALSNYVQFSYVPSPLSIYKGISKLEPGTILSISGMGKEIKMQTYWSAVESAEFGKDNLFSQHDLSIESGLKNVLMASVKEQMISDVPIGAFLSGGVDSSLITALMQSQSTQPIKTFTIGFNDKNYNEAHYAKKVADHLGTDHTELFISPREAQDIIYKLPSVYCEPFADSSQIPTFLVSSLTSKHVTVALSGDAGDELFCGYNRYIFTDRSWKLLTRMPSPLKKLLYKMLVAIPPKLWNNFLEQIQKIIPRMERYSNLGNKIHKGSELLLLNSLEEAYFYTVSAWYKTSIVKGDVSDFTSHNLFGNPRLNDIEAMMLTDTVSYLSDDILVKVDRAAMANSLETRTPFLNKSVYDFAWKIPHTLKMKNGVSKSILKNVLYNYVPKSIVDRPKMGFGIPVEDWLRGPLRDWSESLISENRLNDEGFFNVQSVRQTWKKHLSGDSNYQAKLWPLLMFQAWLDEKK